MSSTPLSSSSAASMRSPFSATKLCQALRIAQPSRIGGNTIHTTSSNNSSTSVRTNTNTPPAICRGNASLQRQYQRQQCRQQYYTNSMFHNQHRSSTVLYNSNVVGWKPRHSKGRSGLGICKFQTQSRGRFNATSMVLLVAFTCVFTFWSKGIREPELTTTSTFNSSSNYHRSKFTTATTTTNHMDHVSPVIIADLSSKTATQHALFQQQQQHQEQSIMNTSTLTPLPRVVVVGTTVNMHTTTTTATGSNAIQQVGMVDENIDPIPDWLAAYIKFHGQHVVQFTGRRGQTEYRLNRSSITTTSVYTLTYHCNGVTCGGLGDRLAGIIQAFYMAVCTHRIFLIDWNPRQNSAELTDFLQPHVLHWHVDNMSDVFQAADTTVEVKAMDNRNNTYLVEPCTLPENCNILLETNLWMGATFVGSQCWRDYTSKFSTHGAAPADTALQLFRRAFRALFEWSPTVLDTTADLRLRAQLVDSSPPTTMVTVVAMHIRTGLLDTTVVHGGSGVSSATTSRTHRHSNPAEWKQFIQCAYKLRNGIQKLCNGRNNSPQDVKLYLAADHISVKDALVLEDASIKMIRELEIHHMDKSKDTSLSQNHYGELAVWAELKLLQQATCLVKSHSKYSEVAADLSVFPLCAVYFDSCDDETVATALSSISRYSNRTMPCTS